MTRGARISRALTWILLVGVSLAGATAAVMSPVGQQRLRELASGDALKKGAQAPVIATDSAGMAPSPELQQRLGGIEASVARLEKKTTENSDRARDMAVALAGLREQLGQIGQVTGSIDQNSATTVLERRPVAATGLSAGSIDVTTMPLTPENLPETSSTDAPDGPPAVLTPMVNLALPVTETVLPAPESTAAAGPPAAEPSAPRPIPVPTVVISDFGIELFRAATIDELEREWKRLRGHQKQALARLEPRISLDFNSSDTARLVLIAGPIRNAADAARLCAQLASVGETCRPVPFGEDTVALNGQP